MQENTFEDLDLLAFRYIADEMTGAEAESFEQRLAADQAACEAVAHAVELAQAVASAPADVIPLPATHSSPRHWLRPARWVAAAAAIAFGVAGWWYVNRSSEESRLATVWAEMFNSTPHDLVADSEEPTLDDESDLTVPVWMLEAVGGEPDSDKWEDS
jgi:ferric-dicitrate binding protein FerR (iron transport regulator)